MNEKREKGNQTEGANAEIDKLVLESDMAFHKLVRELESSQTKLSTREEVDKFVQKIE